MLRKIWRYFADLESYRKFLIVSGTLILADIVFEAITGGLPRNSDEFGSAITYSCAALAALYFAFFPKR